MLNKVALISLAIFTAKVGAQSAPGSDIFLADLAVQEGQLKLGQFENITARKGYDNQPYFLADDSHMLYTAELGKQTDIMSYDLKSGKAKNLSNSPESEYSPTPMSNGKEYSVIHAVDGKQQLWAYQLDGKGRRPLLQNDFKVGYHAWIDDERVLITVLQEKNMNLQIASIATKSAKIVAPLTGASLSKLSEKGVMSFNTFVDEQHTLMQIDANTGEKQKLVELPNSVYHSAWTPDGKVIFADQGKLWFWDSQSNDKTLKPFANIEKSCPGGASRIAVNPQQTKLALVCHGEAL